MFVPWPADQRAQTRVRRVGLCRFRPSRWLALVLFGIALTGCATAGPESVLPRPGRGRTPAPAARFELGQDTFAFANLVRGEHPERAVDFANYCIVMARAASQFYRFARFAPGEPPLAPGEYTRLGREVMAQRPWEAPRRDGERIVIPGYPDLYTLSRAQEEAIKTAFDSNLLSMIHWRTWRVALPLGAGHQSRVAAELVAELDAGQPAPLMITNFPEPDLLNHAVLVYDYRPRFGGVAFLAYDPNDPDTPLEFRYDPATRAFWVAGLPYSPPGRIRVFRLFASPLL